MANECNAAEPIILLSKIERAELISWPSRPQSIPSVNSLKTHFMWEEGTLQKCTFLLYSFVSLSSVGQPYQENRHKSPQLSSLHLHRTSMVLPCAGISHSKTKEKNLAAELCQGHIHVICSSHTSIDRDANRAIRFGIGNHRFGASLHCENHVLWEARLKAIYVNR
jgi:hypothetical protein